jgi:hypothetical protein
MIDPNGIDNALQEISMMVSVVLGRVDTMQGHQHTLSDLSNAG